MRFLTLVQFSYETIYKKRIFTLLNMKVDLETLPRVVGDELDAYMDVVSLIPLHCPACMF